MHGAAILSQPKPKPIDAEPLPLLRRSTGDICVSKTLKMRHIPRSGRAVCDACLRAVLPRTADIT